MVYKSYVLRDNTIVRDSNLNGGRNPIAEIYHGNGRESSTEKFYSRYLVKFDLDNLINKYNSGEICDLDKLTHKLKIYNTSSFNRHIEGTFDSLNKRRATSFELLFFKIPKDFHEGVGYDYEGAVVDTTYLTPPLKQYNNFNFYESTFNKVDSTEPSNWFYAKNTEPWDINGIYDPTTIDLTNYNGGIQDINGLTVIGKMEFEYGSENIDFDITEYVNQVLNGDIIDYGIGVSFTPDFELRQMDEGLTDTVNFHGKETHTIFEPHIETVYDDIIKDDRQNFYIGKSNRLYLYTKQNYTPITLDELPMVDIIDEDDNILLTIDRSDVKCSGKGVYYVDVDLSDVIDDCSKFNNCDGCTVFTDRWYDMSKDLMGICDISFEFGIVGCLDYYQLTTSDSNLDDIAISLTGINHGEKIKRGDIIKLNLNIKTLGNVYNNIKLNSAEYRIYVLEGKTQINIVDWHEFNNTLSGFNTLLDTNILIPSEYYVDIKLKRGYEVRTLVNKLNFHITNQKY